MITREEAVERAVAYLGRRYIGQLEALEGWPGEVEPYDAGTECDESSIEGWPRRVWRVHIPDDSPHVGADRFLILDAESGAVVTIMSWGE
jgi:hypothetical protein